MEWIKIHKSKIQEIYKLGLIIYDKLHVNIYFFLLSEKSE